MNSCDIKNCTVLDAIINAIDNEHYEAYEDWCKADARMVDIKKKLDNGKNFLSYADYTKLERTYKAHHDIAKNSIEQMKEMQRMKKFITNVVKDVL